MKKMSKSAKLRISGDVVRHLTERGLGEVRGGSQEFQTTRCDFILTAAVPGRPTD